MKGVKLSLQSLCYFLFEIFQIYYTKKLKINYLNKDMPGKKQSGKWEGGVREKIDIMILENFIANH